jgi:8-oxo-dGTP pyrophosphatase MutT (NUDIX family)
VAAVLSRSDISPGGAELNAGEAVPPRPAASVIVLRDAPGGPEVLLVQRNPQQRFMGGAWVFPGGAVHDDDADAAAAGTRELREEAEIELAPDAELVPFVRWITPRAVKTRFDTWFFLVRAPEDQQGRCDGSECVDLRWMTPAEALAAGRREQLALVFPTIRTLERLQEFESVEQALEAARGIDPESILPRVIVRGDRTEVVLPGEPGYDD